MYLMAPALFIFELIVFLFSVIIHEISHGYVAERLGDPTAREQGRLTLNPIAHIDPFGSIILPLLLALPTLLFGAPSVIFGWAKPVPYDPRNLKNPKHGAGLIAIAGPISNLALAAVFGFLGLLIPLEASLKTTIAQAVIYGAVPTLGFYGMMYYLFGIIIWINILLAIFNLVPIPPLDGSKVLFAILPTRRATLEAMQWLERYGMILVLFFIFFGFDLLLPVIYWLFGVFTGHSLGF